MWPWWPHDLGKCTDCACFQFILFVVLFYSHSSLFWSQSTLQFGKTCLFLCFLCKLHQGLTVWSSVTKIQLLMAQPLESGMHFFIEQRTHLVTEGQPHAVFKWICILWKQFSQTHIFNIHCVIWPWKLQPWTVCF